MKQLSSTRLFFPDGFKNCNLAIAIEMPGILRTSIKKILLASFLLVVSLTIFSQATRIDHAINTRYSSCGFLEFRPSDYTTGKHPLIIFLHGLGEMGNGSVSDMARIFGVPSTIPYYCQQSGDLTANVGGVTSSFVVLAPQLTQPSGQNYWVTGPVYDMQAYATSDLADHVDPDRIYVTGLSLGGGGVWASITNSGFAAFDGKIAAAAPVCGTQQMAEIPDFCIIGQNHLPVWAFHCMGDDGVHGGVSYTATQHGQTLANNCSVAPQTPLNPAAMFTYYQDVINGDPHSTAWVNAYDRGNITVRVNANGNGPITSQTFDTNLYQWFLKNPRVHYTTNTLPLNNAILTTPTSATLTWASSNSSSSSNVASYDIYLWTGSTAPTTPTANVSASATSYSAIGLNPSTTYSWYIVPKNVSNGTPVIGTAPTSTFTTATGTPTPPGCVTNIAPANGTPLTTQTTAALSWNTATNATSYDVYLWTGATAPTTATANITTTAYSATGLAAATSYNWYVVPKNATGSATGCVSNKTTFTTAATGTPPVSVPGPDQYILLPANTITLNGTGSTGTITSYLWEKVSGPGGTITDPNSATTTVTSLTVGRYVYKLTVTGSAGTNSKTMNLYVNSAPIANAGTNTAITLPTNSVTLDGGGSMDDDGIKTYTWTLISGPSSPAIAAIKTPNVTNLTQGTYVFKLVVTDWASVSSSNNSTVSITVNPAANTAPVANAGNDIPATPGSVTLDGSGSTGSISEYYWYYISGPTGSSFNNAFLQKPTVSGLTVGTYIFGLQVKGTGFPNSYDAVTVTVTASGLRTATPVVSLPAIATGAEVPAGKLSLYPNPVHNTTVIELVSADNSSKTIHLYNATGVLKATYTWQIIKGRNIFSLKNIPDLGNGLYIVDIRDSYGKPVGNLKFIKL